jgi:hypothetical protein
MGLGCRLERPAYLSHRQAAGDYGSRLVFDRQPEE